MIANVKWELIFLVAGVTAAALTSFLIIYRNYEDIERKVLEGISSYASQIYDQLDRMFLRQPVNKVYLMIVIPAIFCGLVGFGIGINFGFLESIVASLVFALIGFRLPGLIVNNMFQKRLEKFDRQLVDALNMMANAVKSGLSFLQVIQVMEREMPSPCSDEFGMVLRENRVGVNLNDALMNMTKRVPSEDLFMIINSVVTLSQQGGDLSEAFDTIAFTIRERQRVREKIKTFAQAGVTQSFIMALLPVGFIGMMYFIQPTYTMLLFTTTLGWFFLGAVGVLVVAGALWIKKILTIEI